MTYQGLFLAKQVFKHSRKGKPPDKFECEVYEDKTSCVIA